MADKPTRKPGRPKGSSWRNEGDAQLLQHAAAQIAANPKLTTRAAILRVTGVDKPADLRRLQTKFRRDEMVTAAKQRMAEGTAPFHGVTMDQLAKFLQDGVTNAHAHFKALGLLNPPASNPLVKMVSEMQTAMGLLRRVNIPGLDKHQEMLRIVYPHGVGIQELKKAIGQDKI